MPPGDTLNNNNNELKWCIMKHSNSICLANNHHHNNISYSIQVILVSKFKLVFRVAIKVSNKQLQNFNKFFLAELLPLSACLPVTQNLCRMFS